MKKVWSSITELTSASFTFLKNIFAEKNEQKAQQKIAAQKVAINNYATMMQQDIQKELFLAFQGNQYPSLYPIIASSNIRVNGLRFVNNCIIFSYRLAAQSIPANTILNIIKNNMNTDIYQCQKNLISSMGLYCAASFHPYIIYGLYIIDIYPDGTDICIDVVTNYYP